MVKSQILTRFTMNKNIKIKIMSKGSGGNRASPSSKPAAMSGGGNINAMIKAGDAKGVLNNILNDTSVIKRLEDEYGNVSKIGQSKTKVQNGELSLGNLTVNVRSNPWNGEKYIEAELGWAKDSIYLSYRGNFTTKERIVERLIDVIKKGKKAGRMHYD